MKLLIVAVAAVVASSSLPVHADTYPNAHKRHIKGHYPQNASRHHDYKQAYPDRYGWFPHDANQLKFGSALWWEQMLRENRLNSGGGGKG